MGYTLGLSAFLFLLFLILTTLACKFNRNGLTNRYYPSNAGLTSSVFLRSLQVPPETTTGQSAEIVYLADPLNMQLAGRSSVQYGQMKLLLFFLFHFKLHVTLWVGIPFFYNNIVFPAQGEYYLFLPILGWKHSSENSYIIAYDIFLLEYIRYYLQWDRYRSVWIESEVSNIWLV